jgi:hypothetical protein
MRFISGIFNLTPSHRKITVYTFSATFRAQGLLFVTWDIEIVVANTSFHPTFSKINPEQ